MSVELFDDDAVLEEDDEDECHNCPYKYQNTDVCKKCIVYLWQQAL
jgi:hypothetical protein